MQTKLSTARVKKLEPKEKPYEVVDTDLKGFLVRVQPTGRKTFYYSYRADDAKRKRIKIGVLGSDKTFAQAKDDATAYAGNVASGVDVQREKIESRHNAKSLSENTLANFLDSQYEAWAKANTKSGASTVASVRSAFKAFLNTPLPDIHIKRIEKWRIKKLNDGLRPTTVNRLTSALRGVLSRAVEWDIIDKHPLAKLKPLQSNDNLHSRYLSKDEEKRLTAALEARDEQMKADRSSANTFRKARGYDLLPSLKKCTFGDYLTPMVICSLKTGLRRGELFDLEWQDINFDSKVLTVRAEHAKSSKTRHVPLSQTALKTLKNWKKQADLNHARVFPAADGERLTTVKTAWNNLLNAASITDFRWHDMRHDFASQLVMKGVPLNTVRELCGHADINTTLRYAHLAPDHKADAIKLLG